MADDQGDIEFPGMQAHWVGHPTDIDDTGCDGLYFDGYVITDLELWIRFCNYVCKPFMFFSVN